MPSWLDRVQNMWRAFERPSAFGVDVQYNHVTAGTFTIRGIINGISNEIDPDTGVLIATNTPTLGVNLDDMPAEPSTRGDQVTVAGVTYNVRRSDEDGEGLTELLLYKV